MVDPDSKKLSISEQCDLLGKSRSWFYCQEQKDPVQAYQDNLEKRKIKKLWKQHIFYGYRQIYNHLDKNMSHETSPKWVYKLMKEMGIKAVKKFHDSNMNRIWDEGKEEIFGWLVDYVTPVDMGFDYTQFVTLAAEPGDFTFTETVPTGAIKTVAILDGFTQSNYPAADPTVTVTITADYSNKAEQELHTLIYGNVMTGSVTVRKIYDRNANGVADTVEPGIPGWKFSLSETAVTGESIGLITLTAGVDGIAAYNGLLPGSYTIEKLIPLTGG